MNEKTKQKVVLGIDPGKAGGVCVMSLSPEKVVEVMKSPSTLEERKPLLNSIISDYDVQLVALEQVQVLVRKSVSKEYKIVQSPRAMLTFGKDWGVWYGLLLAHNVKVITVTPHVWHRKIAGSKKKNETRSPKDRLASVLLARFPEISADSRKVKLTFPKTLIDTVGLALYAKYAFFGN